MQTDTVKMAVKKLTDTLERTRIICDVNSQNINAKSAQYKWLD